MCLIGCTVATAHTFPGTSVGPIPDGAGQGPNNYGAPLDVPIVVTGVANGTIDTLSVAFSASHPYVGDLEVTLISPHGQEHLLFARTGATTNTSSGSAANLVAGNVYTFDDTVTDNWWTTVGLANVDIPSSVVRTVVTGGFGVTNPPPTTSILGVFQRRPPNGTWILRFRDGWGGDSGNVVSASITLSTTGNTRLVTRLSDTSDGVCNADCSLREAIEASGPGITSVDRIEFARPLFDSPRRIVLQSNLNTNGLVFALVGPGAHLLTISGQGRYSNAHFQGGSRTLTGVRISESTFVAVSGNSLFHGVEFAFLSDGIELNAQSGGIAEMNDSSIHSITSTGSGTLILPGPALLRRVTVSGNAARGFSSATVLANFSPVTLIDCTITDNQAGWVGGVSGFAQLQNTVIAGNRATSVFPQGQDIFGTFQSLGHNLIGDPGSVAFNQPGDQAGTTAAPLDPVLSPLSRHGGRLPVHVPLSGSPLLDKGKRVHRDARGIALVDLADVPAATGGNHGDIGAAELSPILVTNLDDSGAGSLRQALLDAPAAPQVTDILFAFAMPPAARIALTSGQLSIEKNVAIHGPGAKKLTINANRGSRVIAVQPDLRVSLTGLTLSDGNGAGLPENYSGGIVFSGTGSQVSIVDSVLRSGEASQGVGGWLVDSFASAEFIGSTANDMPTNVVLAARSGAQLQLFRSTLSKCAVVCLGDDGDSDITVIDSTIAAADGIALSLFGRLVTRNSLYAGQVNIDSGATVSSAGYNVVGASASSAFDFNDQVGTLAAPLDLRLSPLANFVGTVPTHVPLAGSPALDKGLRFSADVRRRPLFDITSIPSASGGDQSDVGAVEVQALYVTNTGNAGPGSLRQAVQDANTNGIGLDDILFDLPTFPSTITLGSRLPNPISGGSINLLGTGADRITLSGGSAVQLFSYTAPGHLGMSRLSLADFRSVDGPALEVYQSEVHLSELEVRGNQASRDGGAMLIADADAVIQSSTFANNSAAGNHGAIAYLGSNSRMRIHTSTFSGNAGLAGSAVANVARGAGTSVLELDSTTLAGNSGSAALITTASSSGAANSSARNTLFSSGGSSISNSGASASFTSQGFNLSATSEPLLNRSTDQVNAAPNLGPLQANGGPTRTRALLIGSAAIDAGLASSIHDQRGSVRPSDEPASFNAYDSSDVGAFEAQPVTLMGTTGGDVFEITGNSITTVVRLNGSEIFNQPTANQMSLTLDGGDGTDTFNVLSISIPLALNGGSGADVFNLGTSNAPGVPGLLTPSVPRSS
ncbi:MAG: proprotein convertase P-domain-containing protein [Ahniella sp.]|nr:proprotein convertase P-domain-containing protein [Ahniella sp.]